MSDKYSRSQNERTITYDDLIDSDDNSISDKLMDDTEKVKEDIKDIKDKMIDNLIEQVDEAEQLLKFRNEKDNLFLKMKQN